MQGSIQAKDIAKSEAEKDAQWVRRGKKYKTKYFTALKELFKEVRISTDNNFEQENCCPNRKSISNIE